MTTIRAPPAARPSQRSARPHPSCGLVSPPTQKGIAPVQQAITQLFSNLLTLGVAVGGAVCAFFLMWAGYQYMSAGSNSRQMEGAKQALFNALAGLAIIIGAKLLAGMIVSALAGIGG